MSALPLIDLLRRRRALPVEDVWQLLSSLPALLDDAAERDELPHKNLITSVNLVFSAPVDSRTACRPVKEWPAFRLRLPVGAKSGDAQATVITVGIENPLRAYDNEPPIATVRIANAALATSGSSRRGFLVAGTRFNHVIDPRTGWPVGHIVSSSVVAHDTATADALATLTNILDPSDGIAAADRFGVAACIIDRYGDLHTHAAWAKISCTG